MSSRTADQVKVAELLAKAKEALGLSLTFLSRMDGETQHLEVVESSIPLFRDGQTQPRETSFCQAVLDGRLPNVIPNVAKLPEAKRLPAARFPRIRSFVSVPVTFSDGTVYGTFCAAGFTSDNQLSKRDQALMEVLADATAAIVEPGVVEREQHAAIRERLEPVIASGGPRVLLQPIVALADGRRVGAEALSRFPEEWAMRPDEVFAEAGAIGAGAVMELLALAGAAEHLATTDGYVAMNLSPATLQDSRCPELFEGLPAERVVLELSEHDPVDDYDALHIALAPLRQRGMRLAIDDVGAGYSSLRHIVLTAPDIIKLDRSIVTGVGSDPVLRNLVDSLVAFSRSSGASVVAEGVETLDDVTQLRELHVDYGQGWYFGRAMPPSELADRYDLSTASAGRAVPALPSSDEASSPTMPTSSGPTRPAGHSAG